jgi:hypothetical protein
MPTTGGAAAQIACCWDHSSALAVDGVYVYWGSGGKIERAAIAAPAAATEVTDAADSACAYSVAMVADGTNLYWLNSDGSLYAIPLAGGPRKQLVKGAGPHAFGLLLRPPPLVVSSGYLYWADPSWIRKTATTGGPVTTIAPKEPLGFPYSSIGAIAVDSRFVYLGIPAGYPDYPGALLRVAQ